MTPATTRTASPLQCRGNPTFDAKKISPRRRLSRKAPKLNQPTVTFGRSLQRIATHIGHLVELHEGHPVDDLTALLHAYAKALRPWARRASAKMIGEVNGADEQVWRKLAKSMSAQLRFDLARTPMGGLIAGLMAEQTDLITSLPIDAATRIQRLTVEKLVSGGRAKEIAQEIAASGMVSAARAKLIARTEVSRTQSNLSQARAAQAGATHYIWRTVQDSDVRVGHQAMEGVICEWATPPEVNENGRLMHHHPGCIWNCRCWAETIINE